MYSNDKRHIDFKYSKKIMSVKRGDFGKHVNGDKDDHHKSLQGKQVTQRHHEVNGTLAML